MPGKKQRKLHQILSDIIDPSWLEMKDLALQEFCTQPQLWQYNLQARDALVIAQAWNKQASNEPGLGLAEIQNFLNLPEWSVGDHLEYLAGLIDRSILNTTQFLPQDYRRFPLQLLNAEFRLASSFAYLVMELKPAEMIRQGNDFDIYFEEQLVSLIDAVFDQMEAYYWEAAGKMIERIDATCPEYYLECVDPLINVLRFGVDVPIARAVRKARLNKKETAIVIYLIHSLVNDLPDPNDEQLCRLVSRNPEEEQDNQHLLEDDSRLIKSKIVHFKGSRNFLNPTLLAVEDDVDSYIADLKHETDQYASGANGKDNQALRKLPNLHTLRDLILPQRDMDLLNAALKRFKQGNYSDLAQWGINPPGSDGQSKSKGLTVLFYGEPGTGKTFAAGAIARELNKDLLGIDATQLRNHWYGDTQKLVRSLFENMTRIVKESDNPPVFLLNECDQIIHKREPSAEGASNVENAIQNIVLEEMERFPGILIMTTNLVENIDPAYFRRFNIKIEFTLPDLDCRTRLWQAHLLPSIPGAEAIPVAALARDYFFTGGQISLVIQNACFEAISREGEERKLLLQDILKYASLEQPWIGKGKKKAVGFAACR